MAVLVWLILAHVVGSFYLYRRSGTDSSGSSLRAISGYALVVGATLSGLVFLEQLGGVWQVVVAWLLVTCAFALSRLLKPVKPTMILLEHGVNLLIIVVIWAWLTGFTPFVWMWMFAILLQREFLLAVILYLVAARPASFFIAALLRKQADELQAHSQSQGLVEAGRMIGYVERWLVLSFVLGGQFAGIGFLLAAKSIFRFGDLSQAHERKLTEYMLLGTLTSFACAIFLGALGRYLMM